MSERLVIGPSTGWLYQKGIFSIKEQEIMIEDAGANAVEIAVVLDEEGKRLASVSGKETFGQFSDYTSLHLPDFTPGSDPKTQADLWERVCKKNIVDAMVIHPLTFNGKYPYYFYRTIGSRGVPLAFENMDKTKNSGYDENDLQRLTASKTFHFVLDVQHAFEHDPQMDYARKLFQMLKDCLFHLHVSGETPTCKHSLVYNAGNAKTIIDFIRYVLCRINVPIILEGRYETAKELETEIEFLRKELHH